MVLNGIRNPITWIYFNPLSMMTVLVIFGTLTFLMLLDFMQRPLLLKKVRSEEVGESLFQTTLNLFFMNRDGYNDKTQKYISVVEPGNNKIKHILVNESKLTKHVLNITDEAIERLYASKWKRSANVTTFPIPSFDNRYKMKCSVTCSTENAPFFIYIVQTATQHFLRRSIIRKTWGNKHFFQTNTFEIVFMLGKPANENMQILLEQEQYVHNDLVQGTFLDTYRNLTHKSVLVLRWFTENCPRVKFLVRVDDDVFVNTFYLIELLTKKYYDVKRKLIGDTIKKGPIQRTSGKWIVNKNEFKNLTHYPFPYTNGPFGIVTGDIVAELFAASKLVPFFWIEDVYIYGLLPQIVGNVEHMDLGGLVKKVNTTNYNGLFECYQSNDRKCLKVVAFPLESEIQFDLWRLCFHQFKTFASELLN